MPMSRGGENPVSGAATEPPAAGFGAYGGLHRSEAPRRATRNPGIGLGLVKAVFIRSWAQSCIDPSS